MSLKKVIKYFLPSPVTEAWRILAAHKSAKRNYEYLKSLSVPDIRISKHFKLIVGRKELLDYLPQGGVCAEVGVAEGAFSAQTPLRRLLF
ncbi:hypothetical protein N9128_02770 [Akkermansiaceae bacterium]|nr:hypothetical protein [Akkermansiaceae bacterium]